MQAKKTLLYTDASSLSTDNAEIYDPQIGEWRYLGTISSKVEELLEKMVGLLEPGDNLAITIEVVEDA